MIADVRELIPAPDMLGLPVEPGLAQILMALTLALHWAFLAMTFGGATAYVLAGRSDGPLAGVRKSLAAYLPLSLATAMTLGIAPLLFVQVLYGQFFYTANILMGWVWLGLLGVVIALFYVLWLGWIRVRRGGSGRIVGVVAAGLMAVAALILVANATLTQSPDAWTAQRLRGPGVPYMADPLFAPRWALALSAMLAGGGLFAALFLHLGSGGRDAARPRVARLLTASVAGFVGMAAAAVAAAVATPQDHARVLMGSSEAAFVYAAAAGIALTGVLSLIACVRRTTAAMLAPAATMVATLLAVAAVRDALRRAALAEVFDLYAVPVHAQWSSFALFAVIFVLGLAYLAYLARVVFTARVGAETRSA